EFLHVGTHRQQEETQSKIVMFRLALLKDCLSRHEGQRSTQTAMASQFGSFGSYPERTLIGEQRRGAAGVQEDDILVLAPASLADQGDQACEPFARIDGIERKRFEPAG